MNSKRNSDENLEVKIRSLIISLRRGEDINNNWQNLKGLLENRTSEICSTLNSRWLISITDTYADNGNAIEKRNALFVSMLGNFEKLFATRLLMYDLKLNPKKVKKLKSAMIVPLWDGMTSFNLKNGNMTNNLFGRIRLMLKETPVIEAIFETVLKRIALYETTLSDLNQYHQNIFENPRKKSNCMMCLKRILLFRIL